MRRQRAAATALLHWVRKSEATYNGGVAVGWESKSEGRSSIAIGSESKSTSKDWGGVAIGASAESNGSFSLALGGMSKAIGGWNIAIGTEASTTAEYFGTAIGYKASVTKKQALAFGTMAEAGGDSAVSVGVMAKSLANNGLAIGTLSKVNETGGRGIAIGNAAYVGALRQGDTTAMPKPSDEWKPSNPYVSQDDNTKPGKDEGAQEKAMAIGFKASAFGYQTTALGAGAQAHDSNTTAVGTAAVAKVTTARHWACRHVHLKKNRHRSAIGQIPARNSQRLSVPIPLCTKRRRSPRIRCACL